MRDFLRFINLDRPTEKWHERMTIKVEKMQSQIFFMLSDSLQSLFEKAAHDGNNDTDNYHGGDGEVYLQVRPVNDYISRQASDGQFAEPWPEKPYSQKYDTQYD